jgi:hypothetical protein
MLVVAVLDVCRYQIEHAVAHAPLGQQQVGEVAYGRSRATQEYRFDAIVVVKMRVHGRQREVVMPVLERRQALRQFAFMMVVDIGEGGNAARRLVALQLMLAELLPQQVAYRLRAIAIALGADQLIEGCGEWGIERDGETFHAW